MKKLFIPILLTTTTPLIALSSCNESDKNIVYQEISDEGKSYVEYFIQYKYKDELSEQNIDSLFQKYEARPQNWLETSLQASIDEVRSSIPNIDSIFKKDVELSNMFETYYVEPWNADGLTNDNYDKIIIYFHGGAYSNNLSSTHISAILKLANKFNAKVYVPIYGCLPQYSAFECYQYLDNIYQTICTRHTDKPFVFVGDSAGGGLAFAYSQYLYNKNTSKLPIARILFSPWYDLTLTNKDIPGQEPTDIFLTAFGLKVLGQVWAKRWLTTDYRVSPIYGEMEDKIKTITFVGTGEIFKPDVLNVHRTLLKNNCNSKVVLGKGLFHVYPIFPLPESNEAFDIALDFLNNN